MNMFTKESSYLQNGMLVERYSSESNTYFSLFYYNGIEIEAGRNFGISVLMGLGPKQFINVEKKTEFMMNFSFNLGYTF